MSAECNSICCRLNFKMEEASRKKKNNFPDITIKNNLNKNTNPTTTVSIPPSSSHLPQAQHPVIHDRITNCFYCVFYITNKMQLIQCSLLLSALYMFRAVPGSIPGGVTWDFFRGSFRQNHVP